MQSSPHVTQPHFQTNFRVWQPPLPPPLSAGTAGVFSASSFRLPQSRHALWAPALPRDSDRASARASRYRRHPSTRQGFGTRGGLWWVGLWLGWIAATTFSQPAEACLATFGDKGAERWISFKELALLTFSSVQFICEARIEIERKKDEVRLGNGMWEKRKLRFPGSASSWGKSCWWYLIDFIRTKDLYGPPPLSGFMGMKQRSDSHY